MAKENSTPRRSTTIHDDLLELTLLHIPSTVGIIRAAATCKLWRRVIGDAGFLRRFRRRNGPNILGHHYYSKDSITVFVPLAAAPAIDISNSVPIHFLPGSYDHDYEYPELHDSRGGLLALYRSRFRIMVFSPRARRHREIYAMMTEGDSYNHCLGVFLLDPEPDDETLATMSNFRVLYVHLIRHCQDGTKTVQAWVFSARHHHWLQLGTRGVDILIPTADISISPPPFKFVGRAGGSICWSTKGSNNAVLNLDESTGEFTDFTLPGHAGINRNTLPYKRMNLRVVSGDVRTMHLVRIVGDDLELLRYAREGEGEGEGGACVVQRRVRVSQIMASIDESRHSRWWYFSDTAEAAAPGRVVLRDPLLDVDYVWKFSVDTKNIELERVQKLSRLCDRVFPYELPWTISACL